MEKNINTEIRHEEQTEHKYMDCDFYWVELDEDGEKVVRPIGYVYNAEESIDDDDPDLIYRVQWYDYDFTISMEEIQDEDFDLVDICCGYEDTIDDLDVEGAYALLDTGLGNAEEDVIELPIDKVTEDTPCGLYVNYPCSY